jgi:UDP-3-O-[3-hydroxymyristoyl] glucosamine N-acyltransferase
MKKKLNEIARMIDGGIIGDENTEIKGITNYSNPQDGYITFIDKPEPLADLEQSSIGAIIVPQSVKKSQKPCISVKNPKLAFATLMQLFFPPRSFAAVISSNASIAKTAQLSTNVTIEDFVIIGDNVTIGDNTIIRSFVYIDENTIIGNNCCIDPNVMIYDRTQIGNGVKIQSSTVIGSDGFGYIKDESGHLVKIPQVGNVIIEDDVEIGSNVSIDRATFGSTIIRKRVKIDNLVQIAHNVDIGEDTTISGHAGIAGSTRLGKRCTIAAAAGIGDHAILEDDVTLAGKAGVASKKTLKANNIYMGIPARPLSKFIENQGMVSRLPYMMADLKQMKQRIKEIEKRLPEKDQS